jgi:hypothetical protein
MHWKSSSLNLELGLYRVAFGNKTFVVGAEEGMIFSSENGESWQKRWEGKQGVPGDMIHGLVFGGNRFVATGSPRLVGVSTDGVRWTFSGGVAAHRAARPTGNESRGPFADVAEILAQLQALDADFQRVCFGSGKFLARTRVDLFTSESGDSWVTVLPLGESSIPSPGVSPSRFAENIAFGNGRFLALGSPTPALRDLPAGAPLACRTSRDGVTWEPAGPALHSYREENDYRLLFCNGAFVTVFRSGEICATTDGVAWKERSPRLPKEFMPRGLAYGNGRWVAVGYRDEKDYNHSEGRIYTLSGGPGYAGSVEENMRR